MPSKLAGRVATVEVLSCINLLKDGFGSPDPFVKVQCGDTHYRTQTGDGQSPSWVADNKFEFSDPEASTMVTLEVWDYDTIGDNDPMGRATVLLADTMDGETTIWLPLQPMNGLHPMNLGTSPRGEVCVRCSLSALPRDNKPVPAKKAAAAVAEVIEITLREPGSLGLSFSPDAAQVTTHARTLHYQCTTWSITVD